MADVQSQFRQFHEAIKLDNLDENKVLREKRDILVAKLRAGLEAKFKDTGKKAPTFTERNLGSYAMGTGVKPANGRDFDIDVGLYFNVTTDEYLPVALKELVHEQLDKAPHSAEIRRPCVTVTYTRNGEDAYHVDFAVLSAKDKNDDGIARLAKGFSGSSAENKVWEKSGSLEFVELVADHLTGDDRAQFKRIIRYFKRWKDVQFKPKGEGAPRGIGLTLAAYRWFAPSWRFDADGKRVDDDLAAFKQLVEVALAQWRWTHHADGLAERLATPMPVEPRDDPFARMSNVQMEKLKERLEGLRDALRDAKAAEDVVVACKTLRGVLGDDFPVPDKPKTVSGSTAPAILSGGGHFA